ncbi:uncharacterized protein LOC144471976 [Augochlora pura]
MTTPFTAVKPAQTRPNTFKRTCNLCNLLAAPMNHQLRRRFSTSQFPNKSTPRHNPAHSITPSTVAPSAQLLPEPSSTDRPRGMSRDRGEGNCAVRLMSEAERALRNHFIVPIAFVDNRWRIHSRVLHWKSTNRRASFIKLIPADL